MDRLLKLLRLINVEPLLLLYGISLTLYQTVFQAFFTYKECIGRLTADSSLGPVAIRDYCLALGATAESSRSNYGNRTLSHITFDETAFLNQVQASTALFLIIYQIVTTLPAIFAAMFMGAWCDTHGRKPIILVTTTGTTVSLALAVSVACVDSIPLATMLVAALIKSVTGGGVIVHLAAFAMISDVATSRAVFTMRIGIASGMISLGGLLGSVLSGAVLAKWDNFSYIFVLSSVFCTLAFLYASFFVAETYHWAMRRRASLVQDPDSAVACDDEPMDAYYDCQPSLDYYYYDPRNLFCSMFTSMRESISVLIRQRQGNRRVYMLVSLVAFMVAYMCEPSGVMNLYLKRPPLSFTDSQYSYYMAAITAANVVGAMILPVLLKRFFGVSDISLILAGIVIGLSRKCILAYSTEAWMVFFAAGAGGLSAMYTIGFRSYIPSLVQRTETGRLFAAISSVEYCGPMLSALIVNNIYAATLEWFPGAVFLVAASIATCVFLVMSFIQMDSHIVDGGELKWCDEEEECTKRRLSLYEDAGRHDLCDLYEYSS